MRFELPSLARDAGFSLLHHPQVTSTNDLAIKAALEGQERLWIVADSQQAGRGRAGRDWYSLPGNLYASLALVAPCSPADSPKLGFVVGVALARTIAEVAPSAASRFHLKWPNDGLMDGKKLSGILLEGAVDPQGRQIIALGIGVNITHHPEGLDQAATHLADYAPQMTPQIFFAALATHLAQALQTFSHGTGFPHIIAEWQKCALPQNTPMRIRLSDGEKHGVYVGVNAEGHLCLETPSGITTILAGDVLLDMAAIIAFSSEVGTTSCEENASKHRVRAYSVTKSSPDTF